MTRPYAEVIGDPIAHSKSPLIHNFWLRKLGIDAEYRATRVTRDDLPRYLNHRRHDPAWRGCNVTMPLKQEVAPYLAFFDWNASQARAVNTVIRQSGTVLCGFNTDVEAFIECFGAVDAQIGNYDNHVATYLQILGAGGSAYATAVAAGRTCATDVSVFARDPSKAHALATIAGAPFSEAEPLEDIRPIRNEGDGCDDQRYSHVVVNATSLGMFGIGSVPINLERYFPDTIVVDWVYVPAETDLVRQARWLGLAVVDGLQLLVSQAAHAFTLLFDATPPRECDAELRALLLA